MFIIVSRFELILTQISKKASSENSFLLMKKLLANIY